MQTATELQQKIQQSRSKIRQEYAALGEALNLTHRLRDSVQKKPWSWIGGLFLTGATIPWLLKKPKQIFSQQRPSPLVSSEKKESASLSKMALATSLLQNKTLRSGLFSVATFLLPFAQEAFTDYLSRKKKSHSL